MTGYGYNSNLVQQPPVLPEVEEDWGPVADQQYYRSDNGPSGLSNPLFYGSMGGWYNNCSSDGALGLQTHMPRIQPPPGLAPPPKPRVSISDEELYQALNMSPLPPIQFQPQPTSLNPSLPPLNSHPQIDYLSSETCFPSSSTYDSSGYNDAWQQPTTSKPKEDPYAHYLGNDGDDEMSHGEPERFETMSPTFSIHSFAPTTSTNTAEAEDLEVELINNYIPPPRYTAADEIDIFLRTGTTDDTEYNDDSDSRPTTTYSHRSPKAPTPPASRPAYAQKLKAAAAQKPESSTTAPNSLTSPVSKTSPLFLQTNLQEPAGFTPLLTPNSDALLQKKLSEVVHKPPLRAVGLSAYPAFPQQQQQLNLEHFQENQNYQATSSSSFGDNCPLLCTTGPSEIGQPEKFYPPSHLNRFDYDTDRDLLPLLLDTFKPLPPPQIAPVPVSVPVTVPERLTSTKKLPPTVPSAPIKAPRLSDQELESESQKLAFDVISNLFTNKKEVIARAEKISAPKKPVARNLFCHEEGDLEKARSQEPITMSVLDDWETADDDDLTVRMENLLKDKKKEDVKKTVAKAPTPPSPRTTNEWDPTLLAHVLEIYGVPDYKMQEDVVKAMETSGNGDCKVMWVERKVVFAVFDSVARAKNCLAVSKHDWLRFRSLADSPKSVQDSAKTNASSLSIPKKKQQTTASVARRMVENALGKKAVVSTEKRQEERNQLAAAKAAKKSTIQWD